MLVVNTRGKKGIRHDEPRTIIAVATTVAPGQSDEDGAIRRVSPARPIHDDYASGYANSKWADDADGRVRAHYDGLPADLIAEATTIIGARGTEGYRSCDVMNPNDGVSPDGFVAWLSASAITPYCATTRCDTPDTPIRGGAAAPTDALHAEVRAAKVGPSQDIPHFTAKLTRQLRHRPTTARPAQVRRGRLDALGEWTINGQLALDACRRGIVRMRHRKGKRMVNHEEICREWAHAWVHASPRDFAAQYTDDGVYIDHAFRFSKSGRRAIEEHNAIWHSSVTNFEMTPRRICAFPDGAFMTWVGAGHFVRNLAGIVATGTDFVFHGAIWLKINTVGKIRESEEYYSTTFAQKGGVETYPLISAGERLSPPTTN